MKHSVIIAQGDTMTSNGKAWLMALIMGILIPGLLFSVCEKFIPREPQAPLSAATTAATQLPAASEPLQTSDSDVLVLTDTDSLTQIDMQTYLIGVLLAEMPVDFDAEALKAQAVVARTYAIRSNTSGKKHRYGAVCTESICCQSYRSVEDFFAKGGTSAQLVKVTEAVRSTDNQVLTYNGALIEATYFSCSGGRTEDAQAVWGTDIPYLRAVDSPGEEGAAHFTDAAQFTVDEFAALLGIDPMGISSDFMSTVTRTDGGGIDTLMIAGKRFSGTTLRQRLGLRSTAIEMQVRGNAVYISTKGYGHRVGMSQYGAEAMAVSGSNYREILSHYYPGTVLSPYTRN